MRPAGSALRHRGNSGSRIGAASFCLQARDSSTGSLMPCTLQNAYATPTFPFRFTPSSGNVLPSAFYRSASSLLLVDLQRPGAPTRIACNHSATLSNHLPARFHQSSPNGTSKGSPSSVTKRAIRGIFQSIAHQHPLGMNGTASEPSYLLVIGKKNAPAAGLAINKSADRNAPAVRTTRGGGQKRRRVRGGSKGVCSLQERTRDSQS